MCNIVVVGTGGRLVLRQTTDIEKLSTVPVRQTWIYELEKDSPTNQEPCRIFWISKNDIRSGTPKSQTVTTYRLCHKRKYLEYKIVLSVSSELLNVLNREVTSIFIRRLRLPDTLVQCLRSKPVLQSLPKGLLLHRNVNSDSDKRRRVGEMKNETRTGINRRRWPRGRVNQTGYLCGSPLTSLPPLTEGSDLRYWGEGVDVQSHFRGGDVRSPDRTVAKKQRSGPTKWWKKNQRVLGRHN